MTRADREGPGRPPSQTPRPRSSLPAARPSGTEAANTLPRDAGPETVAAVDLGSNSFHMLVARVVGDEVHVVDRLRERVALATGLDEERKRLGKDARARALTCLSHFGDRVKHMPPGSVRAVGTNTLRQARNARQFLARAEEALGHPIEVISGREEARLIYLGVSHTLHDVSARRLVVDIGGGSTECIVGQGFEPILADSLYMGCLTYSDRFFPDGILDRESFDRAQTAAQYELQSLAQRYRKTGWDSVVGSSGTVLAVHGILRAAGWDEEDITDKGLRRLRKAMVAAGTIERLDLPAMSPERASVLAGGVAILMGVFQSLEVVRMRPCSGALREGLVYDLLGRIRDEDVRDRTIRQLSERYRVDTEQAARVESTATDLLDQVQAGWGLGDEDLRNLLVWAARLHELGVSVSYSGYHKHGAYLVANSDMAGFSRDDQRTLAALLQGQRRRLRTLPFDELADARTEPALRMCLLLRLAVLLNRNRSEQAAPSLRAQARRHNLHLQFPEGWLAQNPLPRAGLEQEVALLKGIGYRLTFE